MWIEGSVFGLGIFEDGLFGSDFEFVRLVDWGQHGNRRILLCLA